MGLVHSSECDSEGLMKNLVRTSAGIEDFVEEEETKDLECLCDDILLYGIYSFLPIPDLYNNMSLVSGRFHSLLESEKSCLFICRRIIREWNKEVSDDHLLQLYETLESYRRVLRFIVGCGWRIGTEKDESIELENIHIQNTLYIIFDKETRSNELKISDGLLDYSADGVIRKSGNYMEEMEALKKRTKESVRLEGTSLTVSNLDHKNRLKSIHKYDLLKYVVIYRIKDIYMNNELVITWKIPKNDGPTLLPYTIEFEREFEISDDGEDHNMIGEYQEDDDYNVLVRYSHLYGPRHPRGWVEFERRIESSDDEEEEDGFRRMNVGARRRTSTENNATSTTHPSITRIMEERNVSCVTPYDHVFY